VRQSGGYEQSRGHQDELGEYLGALSPTTMRAINQALAIALAIA